MFIDAWAANWARFGSEDAGRTVYEQLLQDVRESLAAMGVANVEMPNQIPLARMLEQLILLLALARSGQRL